MSQSAFQSTATMAALACLRTSDVRSSTKHPALCCPRLFLLFLPATLWDRYNHCPHFTNETVAQRVRMTTRRPQLMTDGGRGRPRRAAPGQSWGCCSAFQTTLLCDSVTPLGPGTRQTLSPYLCSFQLETSAPQLDQASHCPSNTWQMPTSSLCLCCSLLNGIPSLFLFTIPYGQLQFSSLQTVPSSTFPPHLSLSFLRTTGDSCTWYLTGLLLVLMLCVYAVYPVRR